MNENTVEAGLYVVVGLAGGVCAGRIGLGLDLVEVVRPLL